MKVQKKKMSLPLKIFYWLSFIFLIAAFIYLGTKNYDHKDFQDNEEFTREFGITTDNVFKYIAGKELLEKMNTENVIVFMANANNKWSSTYASILNNTAKRWKVKEIYYYDFWQDRLRGDYYYEHIVEKLGKYLRELDDGTKDIYAPAVLFVRNGEILGYDDETTFMKGDLEPEEYWTSAKKAQKEVELGVFFQEYLGEEHE